MAGSKEYEFGAQDLYNLLIHYTDGLVPLAGEVRELMCHQTMVRKIGLLVESEEWGEEKPLFLLYDGKRVRSWYKGTEGTKWEQLNETPKMQ
jgi:hypothetical protein